MVSSLYFYTGDFIFLFQNPTMNKYFLIAGSIILFIVGFSCGKGCCKPCKVTSGGVITDTIFATVTKEIPVYVPKVDTIYRPKLQYKFDTLYVELLDGVDTAAILKDFLSTVVYIDTQKVDHGKVIITDTVSKNRIQSRKLKTELTIPTITREVTLTQPKRNIMSLILGGQYNQGLGSAAIGGGLQFKFRNDKAASGMLLIDAAGNKIYQAQLIYPIKLRK